MNFFFGFTALHSSSEMCGCWVFVIEERNLKGQLPQLKLDNCLLHGFHQVSEKMHEENQNEILIHKLCQEPLQNHGVG